MRQVTKEELEKILAKHVGITSYFHDATHQTDYYIGLELVAYITYAQAASHETRTVEFTPEYYFTNLV